jgi:hypothetical protein
MRSFYWMLLGFAGLAFDVPSVQAQTCTKDENCTAPLTCKAGIRECTGEGHMLPDGGMESSEVCETGPSKCTWTVVPCTSDSACTTAHWKCLSFPTEPVSRACFPEAIACTGSQSCPDGWSCSDLSDKTDLLAFWGSKGQTQFCFPNALRGVFDETVEVDSTAMDQNGSDGDLAKAMGSGSSKKTESSGCSVGGLRSATWSWCLFAGLAVVRFVRRRR